MELDIKTVSNIVSGEFSKAAFDFQELLKQKYAEIRDNFKKDFKYE